MKRQLLLTIAALAVFGCTPGTTVPISENEFQDEADIETHLTDVPVEKRAEDEADIETHLTDVPVEKRAEDEADIETHLPDVPIEKRAVSSRKYIIMSFHLMLIFLKLASTSACHYC